MSKHNLEQYGYTLKGAEGQGIKLLSNKNDCHVKVYCSEDEMDEIQSQIHRHVDGVENTQGVVDGTEEFYVIDSDNESYFESWNEALLAKLDPEHTLETLHSVRYTVVSSSKPNDTDKGHDCHTDRTQHRVGDMNSVINNLYYKPYIHRLQGFTGQEKYDLYQLSLRIQEMKGMEKETREVNL